MGYDIYWNVTQWTFSSPIIACLNFLGQNKFGNSMLQNLIHAKVGPYWKTVPSILWTKTSGTVFPNTDLPSGE